MYITQQLFSIMFYLTGIFDDSHGRFVSEIVKIKDSIFILGCVYVPNAGTPTFYYSFSKAF